MARKRAAVGSVKVLRGFFRTPVWMTGLVALLGAGGARAQFACSPEYHQFETDHRKIHSFEIWSPLDPIGAVRDRLRVVTATLPLVTGKDFRCKDYEDTWGDLRSRYAGLSSGQRFRLRRNRWPLDNPA